MNTQSISLARARELAHLVKTTPKKRGKGAGKKTRRTSTAVVSPSFVERYLGHFGVGSAKSGQPTSHHKSRTVKRPIRRKKAARKNR